MLCKSTESISVFVPSRYSDMVVGDGNLDVNSIGNDSAVCICWVTV
jgi:hypothetical protein